MLVVLRLPCFLIYCLSAAYFLTHSTLLASLTLALTHARCVCVCVCLCVFSLYQGKEVCLSFLISWAPQTPADPPPFIPCPTCKALDLWLAVLISVCVCVCVLVNVYINVCLCVCPRSCDSWMNTNQCTCVSGPPVGMHLHVCMSVICLYALMNWFPLCLVSTCWLVVTVETGRAPYLWQSFFQPCVLALLGATLILFVVIFF